VGVGVFQVL